MKDKKRYVMVSMEVIILKMREQMHNMRGERAKRKLIFSVRRNRESWLSVRRITFQI